MQTIPLVPGTGELVPIVEAGTGDWHGMAVSANGSVLCTLNGNGYPVLSYDGGETWVFRNDTGPEPWTSGECMSLDAVVNMHYGLE